MNVFKQLKVVKLLKDLAEEKFADYVNVEQYGFSIVITPKDVEELKEVIKELAEKERLVVEFEREKVDTEKIERELECEVEA